MAEKHRILQIISFASMGGAEKYVYQLTKALAQRGYPCFLVSPPGPFSHRFEELRQFGVTYELLDFRHKPLASLSRLRALVREHRVSMVHSHLYLADLMTFLATLGLRRLARFSTLHMSIRNQGMVSRPRRFQQRLCSILAYQAVNKVFAVSESLRTEAGAYFRLPPRKIVTALNSIDFSTLKVDPAKRARLVARHGLDRPTFKIGCVGSLHRLKSQLTLIRALGENLPDMPDIEAYLIGDGEYREHLLEETKRLDLAARVHFPGIQEDIAEWYSCMDMFVHASFTEGLSTAILEAMYMGLPIAASSIPSTKEIIRHGETGLLFSPGDARGLAEAIVAVRAGKGSVASLGKNARRFVEAHCGIETMTDAIVSHWGG